MNGRCCIGLIFVVAGQVVTQTTTAPTADTTERQAAATQPTAADRALEREQLAKWLEAQPLETEARQAVTADPTRPDVNYEVWFFHSTYNPFGKNIGIPTVGYKLVAVHHDGFRTSLTSQTFGISYEPVRYLNERHQSRVLKIESVHSWHNRRALVCRNGGRTGLLLLELVDDEKRLNVLFQPHPMRGLSYQRLQTIRSDRTEIRFSVDGIPTATVVDKDGNELQSLTANPPAVKYKPWEWIPLGDSMLFYSEREKADMLAELEEHNARVLSKPTSDSEQ
jgi:hypothetical protein